MNHYKLAGGGICFSQLLEQKPTSKRDQRGEVGGWQRFGLHEKYHQPQARSLHVLLMMIDLALLSIQRSLGNNLAAKEA